jgi:hypothetical protein
MWFFDMTSFLFFFLYFALCVCVCVCVERYFILYLYEILQIHYIFSVCPSPTMHYFAEGLLGHVECP